jgi:hypothetical protein
MCCPYSTAAATSSGRPHAGDSARRTARPVQPHGDGKRRGS